MCIFSGDVAGVDSTRIFARALPNNRQLLVYSMNVNAPKELAMVLPIPLKDGFGSNDVKFINLEAHNDFFEQLDSGFPTPINIPWEFVWITLIVTLCSSVGAYCIWPWGVIGGLPLGLILSLLWIITRPLGNEVQSVLPVYKVGSFDASFVPSMYEWNRLDERFHLSEAVWSALPQYADYGFAVFKLKPSTTPSSIHPMAFSFSSRAPDVLYFPTTHVHDGQVHPQEAFDHALYCQSHTAPPNSEWKRSSKPAQAFVSNRLLEEGLFEPSTPCWRRVLVGMFSNEDIFVAHNTATHHNPVADSDLR